MLIGSEDPSSHARPTVTDTTDLVALEAIFKTVGPPHLDPANLNNTTGAKRSYVVVVLGTVRIEATSESRKGSGKAN